MKGNASREHSLIKHALEQLPNSVVMLYKSNTDTACQVSFVVVVSDIDIVSSHGFSYDRKTLALSLHGVFAGM